MNLAKTSFLSFISSAIKIISGLVINKAISVLIGPTGLATIAQFQNFIQLSMTFAKGGINSGVTKLLAQFNDDNPKCEKVVSTALLITLLCSIITGIFIVLFRQEIASNIFNSDDKEYLFILLGCTITLFSTNQLILSIINGYRKIKLFIGVDITQSIYGLIFTTLLIYFFAIDGALIALATNQSVVLVIVIVYIKKNRVFSNLSISRRFDRKIGKVLLSFSIMSITTLVCAPLSQMAIRDIIVSKSGWIDAGYWQGVWLLSNTYLTVVTTALTTYLLPQISSLKDKVDIKLEIFSCLKLIIPFVSLLSLVVFFLRDFIVIVLYSREFLPMSELFAFQMIGNVIKMTAWIFSFVIISKAMTKKHVISEVVATTVFIFSTYVLVDIYGVVGATYSYVITYIVYLVLVFFFVKNEIFSV
ncbi:O-antigen translocase [Vibrio sp. K4]|uniref:O-antigen translocase n=1 Tax=Vibrio sp. K4 TaxID=3391579 RepID=UPI003DA742A2